MLAKNWKRIGLIILIVACFANITSKFVKKVSFNDNVKSTITNVVESVDGTVQNTVDNVKTELTGENKTQNVVTNEDAQESVKTENAPVNNTFVVEEIPEITN